MEIAEVSSYYLVRSVFRPFSQLFRTIGMSVARRKNMLLTLPLQNQTLMLLHNEFLNITVTDRQKDGQRQTYGRTDTQIDER